MSLTLYKQKRNFTNTSEPKPVIGKSKDKNPIFVIQFHKATHDHYDFRLEIDGVLKSWAIPKSPLVLTKKGIKRLAIQVEDHPLSYAKFHGEIPEGNYGAGIVKIWDNGTYELKHKDEKMIEIILHGKKLKGKYVIKNRLSKKRMVVV